MPTKKDRSAFVPLLFLGVLLLGAVGFVCLVTVSTCDRTIDIQAMGYRHAYLGEINGEYFLWECRICDGDFEATLLEKWFSEEDGVPPLEATTLPEAYWQKLSSLGFREFRE